MQDFRFSNTPDGRGIDAVASLIVRPQRLWLPGGEYPDHEAYGDKTIEDIRAGNKLSMNAWHGAEEVGVGTYQRNPRDPTQAEFRYFYVEPTARGRGVASFLLRQMLHEVAIDFPGVTQVVADAKITRPEVVRFALSEGFRVAEVTELNDSQFAHNGQPDVVLLYDLPQAA